MKKYSKKQIDQEGKPLKKYKRHQRVLWCVCDAVENRWRLVMVVLTKTGISSWSRLPACCDLKILVVWLCFHLMICECRIMPIVSVCVCVFANVCTCRLGTFVCVHVLMNTSLVVLCAHELVCKCIFAFQYPLMFSSPSYYMWFMYDIGVWWQSAGLWFGNSICHLWDQTKGARSTVGCMLPDQHTPKTLSFTFRVNAILSVRLHSTRTKLLTASLPPTLQYTQRVKQWSSWWGGIRHTNLALWQKVLTRMISIILRCWIENSKAQRVETGKMELFSMNFKWEPEEVHILTTLGLLKPFHINSLKMEPH